MDNVIIEGSKSDTETEYFCYDCKQLRLSLTNQKTQCGNCGSSNIITGKVGELCKENLLKEKQDV